MNKKPLSSKISLDIAEYLHKTIDTDYNFIKTDEADNLVSPCYYEVFDYFFEKGYVISVAKDYDLAEECFSGAYDWSVDGSSTKDSDAGSYTDTWFEAANKAIESCIDLINKKSVNNE
jgi:hypothetical protein